MEDAIIVCLTNIISMQVGEFLQLGSLGSHISGLNKKQRNYLKNVGIEKFINDHPNNFAIIDGLVVLVHNSHASSTPAPDGNNRNRQISTSSTASSTVSLPSSSAIESIKKDIEKSNLCMVCSDEMDVYAFGSCFHPICYRCSTKLRVLCDDKHCPVCRTELDKVVFTCKLAPMNGLNLSTFIKQQKHGIQFESNFIHGLYKALLEHKCCQRGCDKKYKDFDELKKHLQLKHGEYFCDLCVKQCKIFTHDRKTYSSIELKQHEESGDLGQGSAHSGHPLCEFCECRYLDNDELLRHLQQHHCSCHICKDENYVFYADLPALWEHFSTNHYTCNEIACSIDSSAAFETELELQMHKNKHHVSKKSKSGRRVKQPITIDVTYGRQGGSQFGGSSRPFKLSRAAMSPINNPSDGILQCTGIVISLTSCYGFIERDDCKGFFCENVFFDQASCDLEHSDDLQEFIKCGSRVRAYAKPVKNHRSNWRAVAVDFDVSDNVSTSRTRTNSDSSDVNSIGFPEMAATSTDDFPSLSSHLPVPQQTDSNTAKWSKIVSTKKTPKPASTTVTNGYKPANQGVKKSTAVANLIGVGTIHTNLQGAFGFITKTGHSFEDNIYFHVNSYIDGMSTYSDDFNMYSRIDLTKDLKIGEKVGYELGEPGKIQRQTKSKFRAVKVWKYGIGPEAGNPVAHPVVKHVVNTSKLVVTEIKKISKPNPTLTNNLTSYGLTNLKPPDDDQCSSSSAGTSANADYEAFGLPSSQEFDSDPDDLNSKSSENNLEIFRKVLAALMGGELDDSLLEFDTELEISGLCFNQISYIKFSTNKPPRVYSVLLDVDDFIPPFQHFDLTTFSGFNNAVKTLRKSGVNIIWTEDVIYVDQSKIYITLHRDDNGDLKQMCLHNSAQK